MDQSPAAMPEGLATRPAAPHRAAPWWQVDGAAAEGPAPLSFAQERLWVLDRLQPGNPAYHIPCVVPLHGAVAVAALRDALSDVVARHDALRTRFEVAGGRPMQRVAAAAGVPLPLETCAGADRDARRADARRRAEAEIVRPFDLAQGPPLRALLLAIDEDEHWLVATVHHIVFDAWSLRLFLVELAASYQARLSGHGAELPRPALSYAAYARWQRQRLRGGHLGALMAFWRDRLDGAPAVLDLPLDRPRPAVLSFRGAHHPFTIPPAASQALRALARAEQATPFMVLLALFLTLLHRSTGQEDLVVGTPAANRDRPELEGVIGLFLNTLVLRTAVEADLPFRSLVRRVRAVTLAAYEHQDLPFEKLVEELRPDRNLNINPLFQVLFVLQGGAADGTAAAADGTGGGIAGAAPDALGTGTAKFDLSLYLTDTGGPIAGLWEYNCDLFDAATVARMAGHLVTLAEGIADAPDAAVGDLPLLTDAEHRQFAAWNGTATATIDSRCAHRLVEEQARATPDADALVCDGATVSYRALDARANRLAHRLRAAGAGPEVAVGICVERSVDMVVAVLAVLKAGGPYVPLDPAYPAGRLAVMLDDCRAPVVVVHGPTAAAVPEGYRGTVLRIDDGADTGPAGDDPAPALDPDPVGDADSPGTLAYIIYTSGSTGVPKGVGMSHRSLVNLTLWQNRINPLGPGERTLQYNAFSFDVSALEILSTLSTAGTLVLVSDATRRDPAELAALLVRERVRRLFLPYTALARLADFVAGRELLGLDLLQVISTGEPLQITPAIARFFAALPDCRLHNEYGPTETHFVTEHALPGAPDTWPTLPAVGRPIDNAAVHILDRRGGRVPVGVVGELCAGGLAVAREYVGRPAMTAERFIPDPFGGAPGARLYRTGDLARVRADGTVELLGRRDHQVKVRGFRIELGEIEVALGRHADVDAAVVTARGSDSGNRHLVAYVVAAPGRTLPDAIALRRFLLDRLPEHMVPSVYVAMDRLPLGGTGKVDRYRLPDPAGLAGTGGADAGVAPRNAIEEDIAAMWREVLLRERVGIHDNFFALGGHSLSVIQLATRLREGFGVEVPLHRLFEAPTVAELALVVLQAQAEAADPDEVAHWLDEIESEEEP